MNCRQPDIMGWWYSKFRKLQRTIFRFDCPPSRSKPNAEIETTSKQFQEVKNQAIVSLPERIEDLTWENGQLRQEIAFYQSIWNTMMSVQEKAESIVADLQQTLLTFNRVQIEAEMEWLDVQKLNNWWISRILINES